MNRHQKKVLALAGAIGNLSLTCGVAGVATFAWFTNVERASSNNISIVTPTKDIHLDYVILKYNDDLKQGVLAGEHASDPTQFILPQYDEYIKERNKFSNFIVRANLVFEKPIDTSETEITIEITKSESSTLKAADPNDNNKVKIQMLTSNVTQFKSIVTSYTLDDGADTVVPVGVDIQETAGSYQTDADAMYKTAIDYFATRKTPTTFISLMNGQPVDPLNGNTITLVPELYNVGTIKGAVVYLECSYNEQLVEGFVKDHPEGGLSQLIGDIELINFGIHDIASGSTYGEIATGKYLKMSDFGNSYDGQYLDSYITNSTQAILDGTKTTGAEDLETPSGINTINNKKSISSYITLNQNQVYASDSIDASSFTFSRSEGTFKSNNAHYVGNNTSTNGIISRTRADDMHNNLSYDAESNYEAIIEPKEKPIVEEQEIDMTLQYDVSDEKFAYYSETVNTDHGINLFRYHENDPISATLTGITLTTSDNSSYFEYSVGEYFSLKGVDVVASYTRTNGQGSFTINVTDICNYVLEGGIALTPEKSSFTEAGTKTVTVTYSDRGESFSDSYEITITSDVITQLTITHAPTTLSYAVGETLDVSDLIVTGDFTEAGSVVVLPTEYKLKLSSNNAYVTNGTTLTSEMAGSSVRVTIIYTGGAARAVDYVDPYFTIQIMDYVVEFDSHPEAIDINESIELTITFNGPLTITITGTEGALSFDSVNMVTTLTAPYSGSGFDNSTITIHIYGVDNGYATVTAAHTNHLSFKDSFQVTVGNPPAELVFIAGVDKSDTTTLTKEGFTIVVSDGTFSRDDNYRCYASKTMTITAPAGKKMISIVLTGPNGQNSPTNFEVVTGGGTYTGNTWTGNTTSVQFGNYSKQVQMTRITITYVTMQMYTVTLDPGIGSGTPITVQKAQGETYILPQCSFTPPTDRAFKCWEVNGHQYQPGAEITITDNTVITAIWSDIYVVSFNANGGSGTMNSANVGEGAEYTLPSCGFSAPANMIFDCWKVGGISYQPGQKITINADTVVTAQWKNLYTVTFDNNGGSGTMASVPVADGDSYALPSCTFEAPTGMMFSHWSVGGISKNPGDSITVTSNTVVTAIWGTKCTITFNSGALDTSGTMAPVEMLQGSTYTIPDCSFTRTGFAFVNWTDGVNTYEADDEIIVTTNMTLTAVWEETSSSTVEDVLNNANTYKGSTNSYSSWTAELASGTEYAGQSAGQYTTIQLRSNNNNSGVVVTTSIGTVTKVIIVWDTHTSSGRTLNIYGKNTAYSNPSDLYGDNAGTLIGTIVYGTSTELTINDDYAYIGLRSNSGAMYITSITIIWEV